MINMALKAGGPGDFSNLKPGQGARLAAALPAGELTRRPAEDALARFVALGS